MFEQVVTVVCDDHETTGSLFAKLRNAERAFLDEYYTRFGVPYKGSVDLRIEMTIDQFHDFAANLNGDMIRQTEFISAKKFHGIPIFRRLPNSLDIKHAP